MPSAGLVMRLGTHAGRLPKVARHVNPQDFDCNPAALIFALPDVSISTTVQWSTQSVVTERDLQRFWEQSVAATHPAQGAQALPSKPLRKIGAIQGLVNRE